MPAPCCHRSACACSVVECIALILPGGWVGLRARNGRGLGRSHRCGRLTGRYRLLDEPGVDVAVFTHGPRGRPHVTSGSDAPHSRGNASASK